MQNKIIDCLKKNEKITDWILKDSERTSSELFFVRNQLDMNRRTNLHEYDLHVYVDFEEDGERYTGDAVTKIGPADSETEIASKIEKASISAALVKNPWYPLPEKDDTQPHIKKDLQSQAQFMERFQDIYTAFFGENITRANVNSVELFAVSGKEHIFTSKGVDVEQPVNEFIFELVTDTDIGKEPVEIFRDYYLTEPDIDKIRDIVQKQLEETEGRAIAEPAKQQAHCRVILSGAEVEELLRYYVMHATDTLVYQQISKAQIGEHFIPSGAKQSLDIRVNPALSASTYSGAVDEEGKILTSYPLYEHGIVKNFRTHAQYSHYLGIENHGFVPTFEVQGGQRGYEELKGENSIEILAFSSFQMDVVTGDFGGEFRLARQIRDGKVTYLSGGAISENIGKAQLTMEFSKELQNQKSSVVPKAILFEDVTVTGDSI